MAINKEISKIAREKIGLYLRDARNSKGITKYKVSQFTGLTENQISSIENGEKSYTIDSFLAYITALDCYFYIANKDGHINDIEHLIKKSNKPT